MIEINRKNLEPLIIEEADTVDEAVEYAVRNHISLEGADLSDTDLSWADLKCACLRNTDLSGADLPWADLSDTDLTGTDLSGTDLRGTDLSGANLTGADLSGTDLRGTDLSGANLTGADLSGATIDYSCWPLWYGSLNMKIDKRIFCQLLYHVLRAGKSVKDEEVQKIINNPENIAMANKFHHSCEYGIILQEKTEGR